MKYLLLLFFISSVCCTTSAQLKRPAPPQKKLDSLRLSCPVPGGTLKAPAKEGYQFKDDLKAILKSGNDTLFLAPVDGKIDLITMGDNGKYEIVMHYFNYNIWLTGISQVLVKKNDKMKTGQPVGKINPGDEVEILLFDDEEPVDPVKYLDCKKQ
jgi:hypothetical protein